MRPEIMHSKERRNQSFQRLTCEICIDSTGYCAFFNVTDPQSKF